MKKKSFLWLKFLILVLFTVQSSKVFSQDINLLGDVNVAEFPEVSLSINVSNPKVKTKSSFEVLENNEPVDFDLDVIKTKDSKANKVVLILFEDILHKDHGKQRQVFKDILKNALPGIIKKGDLYNIAFFDRNRDGSTPLRFVLDKYTEDVEELKEKLDSYNHKRDRFNNQKSADLYNAIYDGITELKDKFEGKNKVLVVLSAGKNLELSNYNSISDLINYDKKYKIPVYSLQYMVYEHENIDALAKNTYGKFFHIQGAYKLNGDHSKETASDSLVSFMNSAVERMQGRNYKITYQSGFKKDGKSHTVSIKTDEIVKDISFSTPVCDFKCWIEKNEKLAIALGIGFVLLLLLFGYLINRLVIQKNKKQQRISESIKQQLEMQEDALKQQEIRARELERITIEEKQKHEAEKQQLLSKVQKEKEQERIQKIIQQMKNVKGFSKLRVIKGKDFFDWEINYPEITVGKHPENNLVIEGDHTVSSQHIRIYYKNNAYYIQDLGSTNGTKVNGVKIKEKQLKHNDTIQIGKTKILFIL